MRVFTLPFGSWLIICRCLPVPTIPPHPCSFFGTNSFPFPSPTSARPGGHGPGAVAKERPCLHSPGMSKGKCALAEICPCGGRTLRARVPGPGCDRWRGRHLGGQWGQRRGPVCGKGPWSGSEARRTGGARDGAASWVGPGPAPWLPDPPSPGEQRGGGALSSGERRWPGAFPLRWVPCPPRLRKCGTFAYSPGSKSGVTAMMVLSDLWTFCRFCPYLLGPRRVSLPWLLGLSHPELSPHVAVS